MSRPQHSTALRLRRQHLVNNLMSKINPIEILQQQNSRIFACEVDPPLFTVYFVHSNTYKMYNCNFFKKLILMEIRHIMEVSPTTFMFLGNC